MEWGRWLGAGGRVFRENHGVIADPAADRVTEAKRRAGTEFTLERRGMDGLEISRKGGSSTGGANSNRDTGRWCVVARRERPAIIRPMSDQKPQITAYVKTFCGWSEGVRAIMRKYDLEFEEKDIIKNPAYQGHLDGSYFYNH